MSASVGTPAKGTVELGVASDFLSQGLTFFDTLKFSFKDVPIDGEHDNSISTREFCAAANSLVTLFDLLGSVAFNPVKSDILGNIKKIQNRATAFPAESVTLQDLVRNEIKSKKHVATEGLLWLTRGLDFTAKSLRRNEANTEEELADSFRAAYALTLKPHHSFIVKPIFSAAMIATPHRKDFYARMGADTTKVADQLREWLEALESVVEILQEFLLRQEAKW